MQICPLWVGYMSLMIFRSVVAQRVDSSKKADLDITTLNSWSISIEINACTDLEISHL